MKREIVDSVKMLLGNGDIIINNTVALGMQVITLARFVSIAYFLNTKIRGKK